MTDWNILGSRATEDDARAMAAHWQEREINYLTRVERYGRRWRVMFRKLQNG